MAYIALYRKYRPVTFDNILGQESVTKILKNQVKAGKISHAYLFSGTRGTGKTSAAKVFARAINCLNPKDGEPCNECEVCKSILDGNTSDVIEMDAASNNSVENIRQIRQEVVYATVDVKYRVYIIDEVHMLTTSAFNALLKTLEEPPENVVFILATTEQHKIPVTILSRCLRFEFNRISNENIIERLKYVLDKEKIAYEEEALQFIAKLADGGMRDALSILDRCISEMSEKLTYEDIQRVVGAIDKQIIQNIVDAIEKYDYVKAIENVDIVITKGKDLRQLAYELSEEFLQMLIKSSNNSQKDRLVKIIDRLSKLDNDLRQSSRETIVLKTAIVELCNVSTVTSTDQNGNIDANVSNLIEALNKKITTLENEIVEIKKNGVNVASTKATLPKVQKDSTEKIGNTKISVKPNNENVNNSSTHTLEDMNITIFENSEEMKNELLKQGKIKIYSSLAGANIYLSEMYTLVITANSFAYSVLKSEESTNAIKEILRDNYSIDKPLRVELKETHEDD